MAATNFTPIQLYFSTTASAAPTAANLAQGELAINITDGKLYYEDNAGAVQVIATKGAGTIGGSTTQIQYNNAGALAGNAAMVFNNSTNVTTLTTLNLTNALGATYGGTAQSTYTQGDILYSSASNTLAKLGIGANTYILTSTGSVPQWVAPSSIAVLTATNLAGGLAGSVPYQSALDTTTFLAIGTANRVMTSTGTAPQWVTALTGLTGVSSSSITDTGLTSGRVTFASTSGLLADSSSLTFNGTTLTTAGLSNNGLSTLVKTLTLGDTSFNGAAVFAPATPAKLYMGTGTVTDVTSAISATNTTGAIASLAITPIAATNTGVTYTNASTLYIAGAPSAGTNVTITNPYSLYVAAGASYLASLTLGAALPTASGGTGLGGATPFTSGGVVYASSTSALATGSALTFDGNNLGVGGTATALGTYRGAEFAGTTATTGGFLRMRTSDSSINSLDFTDSNGRAIFTTTNHPVRFGVNDLEKMRLDSTGLGIGTSSPGATLHVAGSSGSVLIQPTNVASALLNMRHGSVATNNYFRVDSNSSTVFGTSGTDKATLDSSGNLGLGVTPQAWDSYKVLEAGFAGSAFVSNAGSSQVGIVRNAYWASGGWKYAGTGTATLQLQQNGEHQFWNAVSGTAGDAISFTQAMTLDSSGNLLVGGTTSLGSSARVQVINPAGNAYGFSTGYSSTAGQFRQIYLWSADDSLRFDNGTNLASLSTAGAWTNASDARIKKNIVDIKYGLIDVLKTKPRSYEMIDVAGEYIGFVAQELQTIIPEVVSGDPEKQLGVDYGSLVALAFKAIQEQQALITQLKARLDAANL